MRARSSTHVGRLSVDCSARPSRLRLAGDKLVVTFCPPGPESPSDICMLETRLGRRKYMTSNGMIPAARSQPRLDLFADIFRIRASRMEATGRGRIKRARDL